MSDLSDLLSWQLSAAAARARTARPAPTDHIHQETTMNDQEIEQEIQAKGLTAPRVTPQRIEDVIIREYFFTAQNGVDGEASAVDLPSPEVRSLQLLTFCVLVLRNGFTVTGESACASPENFDAELGRKIARQHAVNKIWPLEGYLLRERLHEGG